MKQFYTCWVEDTSGGYGYKHPNFEDARKEAERLANLPGNDGKQVYVLCCLGCAKVIRATWEDASQELPF